jgi:predicted metal-dependent peptidase
MAHSERAQIPLTRLAETDMAFASWAIWCKHEDSDQPIAPAWTDGKTIFYAEDYAKFTPEEQVGVAAHEIFHVAFRHPARGLALRERLGPEYRHKIFNIAIDGIVNETLRAAGYKLPKSAIYLCDLLEKFLGMERPKPEDAISEWDSEKLYMTLIRQKASEEQKKQCQQNGGGQGQGEGQGQGQQDDADQQGQGQGQGEGQDAGDQDGQGGGLGDQQGQGKGKGGKSKGKGGQQQKGQGGGGNDYDPTVADVLEQWADENGYKGDLDEEAMSAAAGDAAQEALADADWAQRIQRGLQAAQQGGKMAGNGIGQLGFKIADIPESRTPWEKVLRAAVTKATKRERKPSYMRPTKRFLALDSYAVEIGSRRPVYEQGFLKAKGVPRLCVGVDVSGSIDNRVLRKFAGEISAIGKKTGAEIYVLVFDTEVLSINKMEGLDWDKEITDIEFARGGGTDFRDVIDKSAEMDPSMIIILTDLYAGFGDDPKVPVIWAIEEEQPPCTPPFGKVISMAR